MSKKVDDYERDDDNISSIVVLIRHSVSVSET